ncbi:MAG: hypothetical protein CMK83_06530 [Pseudomonadales bacterium]|jgi:hypothetical protein|nr:hypothetical protein [Pseudomonadales bacterium]MBI26157.1 hypothetical protein [Pseudomonadales bacterium]HAU15243.1 hypothetical protein [Gammaproteobacteria bacterium]|tara:strand:+ start:11387 stop:12940 length:1554 start_codon:yes stop_codon:yes gene_type:complete
MERLSKTPRYVYSTLFAMGISACGGSSLLWEATYDSADANIAVDAALDAQGNLYVVGSHRAQPQDANFDYSGLIVKYNSSGDLVWQNSLPGVTHVHDILPVDDNHILIETTNDWLTGIQLSGSFHLASAADGSPLQQLSNEDTTLWTEAALDQGRIILLNRYRLDNDIGSELQQFDVNGNLTNNLPLTGTPLQIAAMPNGGLYYLGDNEWQSGMRLHALDENLNLMWSSVELSSLNGLCGRFAGFNPVSITTDNNQDILIKCSSGLVKLSAQGALLFTSDYSDLMRAEPDANPELLEFELEPSLITVDNNNDIFISTTRANYLAGQIGNLQTGNFSLLKSDTLVMKISGATGERIWSDDVNGYLLGSANGVTSDFYYPLAMSIIEGELQVTLRGFRGNYTGVVSADDSALTYCSEFTDLYYPLNTCALDSVANAYARTLFFDLGDGMRRNGPSYNEDYPSTALVGTDNTLYMIGDSTWEGAKQYIELNALGQAILSDAGWAEQRDSDSSIYIKKHQL